MNKLLVICIALVSPLAVPAHAQSYPAKPLRLILPYPPGGPTDIMGRTAGGILSKAWGVQVIADNRPGFNGNLGTGLCAKAPADGYTFCTVSGAQAVAPSVSSTVTFDGTRDFSHVTLLAVLPMLLVVHPSLPVKTTRELIAFAQKRPGALNYASTGIGVTPQLTMEMFKQQTKIDIVNVTYKGAMAALVDQMAGRVETSFSIAVGALPFVREGKLRALGVSTRVRFPPLPEVPTIDEAGLTGFDASSWQGIVMPAGVPREIVELMSTTLATGLKAPEMRARILDMGGIVVGNTPEEFAAFYKAEAVKWARVAKGANVRVD
ncbi:MAG: tripartite tricarboxylate transporter substrate binding protein [bacterium]|jgi:tripartite-type tricarboxylate transporter receptor subunit TctC|nr:tripartite tricarboxylate transporter substrate binding protein [Betaproteobacteria bacterium]